MICKGETRRVLLSKQPSRNEVIEYLFQKEDNLNYSVKVGFEILNDAKITFWLTLSLKSGKVLIETLNIEDKLEQTTKIMSFSMFYKEKPHFRFKIENNTFYFQFRNYLSDDNFDEIHNFGSLDGEIWYFVQTKGGMNIIY